MRQAGGAAADPTSRPSQANNRDVGVVVANIRTPSTVAESTPRATGLTPDKIAADHLDYLRHVASYVASPAFR